LLDFTAGILWVHGKIFDLIGFLDETISLSFNCNYAVQRKSHIRTSFLISSIPQRCKTLHCTLSPRHATTLCLMRVGRANFFLLSWNRVNPINQSNFTSVENNQINQSNFTSVENSAI